MDAGDLLILEVRLKPKLGKLELNKLVSEDSLRHDFGPLEYYLGLKFDRSLMKPTVQPLISAIPDTKTIVITYKGPVSDQDPEPRTVTLQYVHLYEPDTFLQAVGDVNDTGFEVVAKVVDRDHAFLECLLRRQ